MTRPICLTLALLCVSTAGLAAPITPKPRIDVGVTRPLFPPAQFEKLGLEELPAIHITAITQDKRGFLWLGTQVGGLARYDGTRITSVPVNGTSFITALEADADGGIWIGTGDAGLAYYDAATDAITTYRHDAQPTSLANDVVSVLTLGSDGTLWVGFGTGDVDRFDRETKTFKRVVNGAFSAGEITAIEVESPDRLVIASNGGGVMRVAQAKTDPRPGWIPENQVIPHDVTALTLDHSGALWVGSADAGLYRLAKNTKTPVVYLPKKEDRSTLSSEKITSLYEDRDHSLWIGTQFGLNEMNAARTQITRYAPDGEFPLRTTTYLQYVETAFQDRSGTLWFGTLDFGLYKLDSIRRRFRNYASTGEFGIPMTFCEAADGTVWAGTYTNGLYRFDFARNEYTEYTAFGSPPDVVPLTSWLTSTYCARDGTVWFGGSGLGLIGFDPTSGRYSHYPAAADGVSGPSADRIEQIVEGKDGALWLATWGGGLGRFDPVSRTFQVVAKDDKVLPSAYLHRILFDAADPQILWIGAELGGVARLDLRTKTSKVFRGTKAGGPLSDDTAQTLHQSNDGAIWIGTSGGGLNRLNPANGKVDVFAEREGIPSVVYGIVPDDNKHLWLTTTKGLIRFEPTTGLAVKFTAADGLGATEFNQNGYFRTKAGDILASTLGGFNRITPKEIVPDTQVPPVVLTGFRLFDKELALSRPIWEQPEINLSYRDSVFTVEFAAVGYVAAKQTKFSYRLSGFRDEWLTTDTGRLTFTNLDHGDYTLEIRVTNRHGHSSDIPTTLAIHIAPPIWRTKPAYVLYFVLLVFAAVGVTYLQRQRVQRAVREGRLAVIEQDLALSGAVQSGFLPERPDIITDAIKIVGFYRAADMCSGDWWWHEKLANSRHLVLVGDVTGHGPGPAMVTAAVATAFHVAMLVGYDIMQMLELLNQEVVRVAKGQYHMTLAVISLDEKGEWELYSAGAPPIMTLDAAGKHRVHFCPGAVLGTEGEFEAGRLTGTLNPGERILVYTDGIPEISMPDGNVLGIRRFGQLFESTRTQPVTAAVGTIVSYADQSLATTRQADDWTFALLEFTQ